MPRQWTEKDERQYEHIRQSERSGQGRSEKRAKQIAAATVNKRRTKEGRTSESRAAGRSAGSSSRTRSRGRSRASARSRSGRGS